MRSDEDLIIQIPDDEPDPAEDILHLDDDTPIVEEVPEQVESVESTFRVPPPDALSWPAVKIYHPMTGAHGTPEEIPEEHGFWMAANIMLAPAGSPLREGASSIFISGKTPEACAQHIYDTIVAVFKQMQEKMSPIQKATMADVPPVIQA